MKRRWSHAPVAGKLRAHGTRCRFISAAVGAGALLLASPTLLAQPAEPPDAAEQPGQPDEPQPPEDAPASEAGEEAPPSEDTAPPAGAEQPEAPIAEPAPQPAAAPAAQPAPPPAEAQPLSPPEATATAAAEPAQPEPKDEMEEPSHVPGYRRHLGLGLSPYVPRIGTLPSGLTPSYAVPKPSDEWTFKWTGFMAASLQASTYQRRRPSPGQARTVFHVRPETIDEWSEFQSTRTVLDNWVEMNFVYGTSRVKATVSISTWNPTRPTSFYQMGSQNFINKMFLTFSPDPVAGIRLQLMAGYFDNAYGGLSQYGSGIYTNTIVGGPRGATGENLVAEYDLSESLILIGEHGFQGGRQEKLPEDVVASQETGWDNPIWPSDYVHHAHLGLQLKGEPRIQGSIHYLTNWSQDDRTALPYDDPFTRQINEAEPKDGRINVYGADARMISGTFGYLAAGVAYIQGRDVFTLRTLDTYGGNGEKLTNNWWGRETGGTGKLLVAGINYSVSIGKIVSYPVPFPGDGPDLNINTGFHIAKTWTDFEAFNERVRHKYGLDAMYTFLSFAGVGLRVDRVVPSSKVPEETFHVVAPRLQFKSDWTSRDNLTLLYAKWFYGSETHKDGSDSRQMDRLDDQLVALSFNMWW
jgi:hypothetical protein